MFGELLDGEFGGAFSAVAFAVPSGFGGDNFRAFGARFPPVACGDCEAFFGRPRADEAAAAAAPAPEC